MFIYLKTKKQSFTFSAVSRLLVLTLSTSLTFAPVASYAQVLPQTVFNLPTVGTMVPLSAGFTPTIIKGMTIFPDNPLNFDFILDTGDENLEGEAFEQESKKLIKYFLASLTVPEEDQWVNLSPYEKDRIVPDALSLTEMGRDLLAQDYLLKQISASLMYPEDEIGQEFWDRVYTKAQKQFGTAEIPMNTFNKIWIVPSKATLYEKDGNIFILENHLKVMLEEDYVALQEGLEIEKFGLDSRTEDNSKIISGVTSDVVREILIPEIEREVNEGKNFAKLRQIYNSMLLATWYKRNLKESLLGQIYVDQNKMKGIDDVGAEDKEKIYNQYVEAFKTGVYNYIREDYDAQTDEIIPRKYFSGGATSYENRSASPIIMANSPVREDLAGVSRVAQVRLDGVQNGKIVQLNVGDDSTRAASPVSIKSAVMAVTMALSLLTSESSLANSVEPVESGETKTGIEVVEFPDFQEPINDSRKAELLNYLFKEQGSEESFLLMSELIKKEGIKVEEIVQYFFDTLVSDVSYETRNAIDDHYRLLESRLIEIDPGLEKALQKIRENIEFLQTPAISPDLRAEKIDEMQSEISHFLNRKNGMVQLFAIVGLLLWTAGSFRLEEKLSKSDGVFKGDARGVVNSLTLAVGILFVVINVSYPSSSLSEEQNKEIIEEMVNFIQGSEKEISKLPEFSYESKSSSSPVELTGRMKEAVGRLLSGHERFLIKAYGYLNDENVDSLSLEDLFGKFNTRREFIGLMNGSVLHAKFWKIKNQIMNMLVSGADPKMVEYVEEHNQASSKIREVIDFLDRSFAASPVSVEEYKRAGVLTREDFLVLKEVFDEHLEGEEDLEKQFNEDPIKIFDLLQKIFIEKIDKQPAPFVATFGAMEPNIPKSDRDRLKGQSRLVYKISEKLKKFAASPVTELNSSDMEVLTVMFGFQLGEQIEEAKAQDNKDQLRAVIHGGILEIFGSSRSNLDLENYLVQSLIDGESVPDALKSYRGSVVSSPVEEMQADSSDKFPETTKTGGINLNPAPLDMDIKRDADWTPIQINTQQILNMNIEGFVPVILNVAPINIPLLLGLMDDEYLNELSYNKLFDSFDKKDSFYIKDPEEIDVLSEKV